jgi:hypothetical protein
MNALSNKGAQWLDRHNGYHDLMVPRLDGEHLLGMVDNTIRGRVRSFVRKADGTWKLEDHDSLAAAKQAVESLAQD